MPSASQEVCGGRCPTQSSTFPMQDYGRQPAPLITVPLVLLFVSPLSVYSQPFLDSTESSSDLLAAPFPAIGRLRRPAHVHSSAIHQCDASQPVPAGRPRQ